MRRLIEIISNNLWNSVGRKGKIIVFLKDVSWYQYWNQLNQRKIKAQARPIKDRNVVITLMRQSRERDISGAQLKGSLVRWLQRWWRWTGHWRCWSWCWCGGCWTTSVSYEESAHVRQDRADQFGLVCDGYANILHSSGADCPSIAEHLEISEGSDCPADK